jgi:hypothetical protein
MKKSLLTLPIPALLALAASTRAATPVTWDGSTANWTDSAHWSLPAPDYPDADHPPGTTYDITVNSGTLNLGGGSYLVDNAILTGGNLANGTLTVANNTTVSGPQATYLNNVALHNLAGGTLTFNGGTFDFRQGWQRASITNDGLLLLLAGGISNLPVINNGQMTASNAITSIMSELTNNGSLTVASTGSLVLGSLATAAGAITIAPGGSLFSTSTTVNLATIIDGNFRSGNTTLNADLTVNGDLTLGNTYLGHQLSVDSLVLTGDLHGPGTLICPGLITLDGGSIQIPLTISNAILFSNTGSLADGLGSHLTIDANATAATDSSFVYMGLGVDAILENKGTFTVHQSSFVFSANPSASSARFLNAGHLIVDPGADKLVRFDSNPFGGDDSSPAFFNSGIVDVNSGTMYIHVADGGNTAGTFNVTAGATLQLDGHLTFGPTSVIHGAGNVLFGRTTIISPQVIFPVTIAGAYAITGNTTIMNVSAFFDSAASANSATIADAAVSGAGTLTIDGAFTINRTTFTGFSMALNGTGSISESNTPASLQIAGTTTLSISSTTALPALTNTAITVNPTGLLILAGAIGPIASTASITNNGTLNLKSIAFRGYQGTNLNPQGLITNNGTLTTSGTNSFSASTTFNNNGLIKILAGSSFTFVAAGTDAPGSSIVVDPGGRLQIFRKLLAGSLTNNGFIAPPGTQHLFIGNGVDTYTFNNNAAVIIFPDLAVTLTVNAAFNDTPASSLSIGDTGSFTFNSPFSMQGSVAGAGTFSLALAPNTTDPGSTLSGPYSLTGTTALSNAHATFAPSANASTANLLLTSNATLSGNLTVTSALTLDSSTINAALTTSTANISIKQSTAAAPTLDTTTLTIAANHTASVDTDATLHLHNASLINNGTLTIAHTVTLDTASAAGTLHNAGLLTLSAATTLAADLTFQNPGAVDIQSGALLLAAAQDPLTTGTFTVESTATLQFAADYSFAAATDPTLSGDGLLVINPNTTLTLAIDTAFSGTIQVDGTLILAPARDPANQNTQPHFSILPTPIPEPATLSLLALAAPLFLRHRR